MSPSKTSKKQLTKKENIYSSEHASHDQVFCTRPNILCTESKIGGIHERLPILKKETVCELIAFSVKIASFTGCSQEVIREYVKP